MKGFKILIVDDEPDLRDAIAFDFKRKNFTVLTAASGREAIRLLEGESVDVVLSDVRMPDGDGLDLLDWAKARDVFTPVVMLATGFSEISIEEAYDRGADFMFSKPFDRKALMAAVDRASKPASERMSCKNPHVKQDQDIPIGLKSLQTGCQIGSVAISLGRGGFFAATADGIFPEQTEVEFRLGPLPENGEFLVGRGIVRWCREAVGALPGGCGIEFLELDQNTCAWLPRLINGLKIKQYIPIK